MLLDVKSVDKKFNGVYALKGLDFSLGEGEVHGLIGENGAGKSTFIKILGGVYKRDVGNILWNGKDLPEVIRPEESRKLGGRTVLEEYIQGREIQVAVLEDRALPSIEIIPKEGFYDYENKYQPGAALEVCPAQIPPEWEQRLGEAALAVFRTIGLSVYARADFIVTPDGTPYFLEINTLPGMTPTSLVPQEAAAVGIGYGALCQTIVEASLKARKGGA